MSAIAMPGVPHRQDGSASSESDGAATGEAAAAATVSASTDLLRMMSDALPQMVWSTRPDGFHDYYNAQWYTFTGVAAGSTDGDGWQALFHPDDQPRARLSWERSLATGAAYEIEYRLRHHSGEYRWTLGRALPVRNAAGKITRWVGTCTDIDASKRAAEQNVLLSRELDHRIKNLFAVVSSLIGQSGRAHPEMEPLADELQDRIAALGRAHDYVRPQDDPAPRLLQAMLAELLRPYPAFDQGRITITGDDLPVGIDAATPVALVVHELATNAVKYGALASAEGALDIALAVDADRVRLDWRETGSAAPPPAATGFGARLLETTIERQLRGSLTRVWHSGGLQVTIDVPVARLH